jgi:spoIIIJ-associated protein
MDANQVSQLMEQHTAQMLNLLGVQAEIVVDALTTEGKQYIDIRIQTEGEAAELIGHAGSRLKALSTVLNMLLPKTEERYSVLLDINGYRDQRTNYIKEMAQKAAAEAIDTMAAVELDAMSAWERRIVHMELAERTDVMTLSEGDEGDRRVVVKPVSVV